MMIMMMIVCVGVFNSVLVFIIVLSFWNNVYQSTNHFSGVDSVESVR